MFSWLDKPDLPPSFRAGRGYGSAREYGCHSVSFRHDNLGFRPAFEIINSNDVPADILDGDTIIIGTLYMDGKPIKFSQNPRWKRNTMDYIPGATLEFGDALSDSAYHIKAIKCGNVFICDRCLLKNISYNDIITGLKNRPVLRTSEKLFKYKVLIPSNEEYDYFIDVTDENNDIANWEKMCSWVDDSEFTTKHPNRCMYRGYISSRYCGHSPVYFRCLDVGFRPAFKPLYNNSLPIDIEDGDIIAIGTLYLDGKPVRVPQKPTEYGDIEDYTPGATLEFRPAIDAPAYQVKAIKAGDVFICDRCLLKNISYDDICASFPNNN